MNPLPGAIVVQDDAPHPLLAGIAFGAGLVLLLYVVVRFRPIWSNHANL